MDTSKKEIAEDLLGPDDLSDHQIKVVESIVSHEPIAENANEIFEENLSFGDRLADQVASFGGSWKFIMIFLGFMVSWIVLNTVVLINGAEFDPYPFILLNLGLSTTAALQAPIIMMSQNRHGEKDRIKADQTYQVSLKSDLEITRLHMKIDELNALIVATASNSGNQKS